MAAATQIIERQLKLALFVREHGPISRKAICQTLSCYHVEGLSDASLRRKFERDKQDLAALGLVLKADQQGLYTIDQAASFGTELGLTPAEASVLRSALSLMLQDPSYPLKDEVRMALVKLGEELEVPDSLSLGAGASQAALLSPGTVHKVRSCLEHGTVLRFTYEDAQGALSRRAVACRGCFLREGVCYLVAFDLDKRGMRTFRLDRMTQLSAGKALDVSLACAKPFDPSEWCKPSYQLGRNPRSATLADAAGATFEVTYANQSELARWAIQQGFSIVEPAGAAREQAALLEGCLASLGEDGSHQPQSLPAPRKARTAEKSSSSPLFPLALLLEQAGMVSIPQAAQLLGCTQDQVFDTLEQLAFCYDEAAGIRLELGSRGCSFARLSRPSKQVVRLTVSELSVVFDALAACGLERGNALMERITRAKGVRGALQSAAAPQHVHSTQRQCSYQVMEVLATCCELEGQAWVDLSYQAESASARQYTVRPQALEAFNGHWYLRGTCAESGKECSFRLDRINSAQRLDVECSATGPTAYEQAQREKVTYGLVALEAGTPLPNWNGIIPLRRLANGSRECALPWYGGSWLPRHLASQGGNIRPLHPLSLVEATAACCV